MKYYLNQQGNYWLIVQAETSIKKENKRMQKQKKCGIDYEAQTAGCVKR